MKKTEIKKLDLLWSKLIRERGHCEICGKTENLNAHHIIGRRNFSLRWDRKNGVCLCAGHHTFARESAHQDPEWFHDWLEENRALDVSYLRRQRNVVSERTYEEVIKQLEEKC